MGDRGNIVVRTGETNKDDVWFYTHWSGSDMPEIVKRALARKERWTDASYLARIVFTELIGDDKGNTGYGISTSISDNEHDILVVDVPKQLVYTIEEKDLDDSGRLPSRYTPVLKASFADYILEETAKA